MTRRPDSASQPHPGRVKLPVQLPRHPLGRVELTALNELGYGVVSLGCAVQLSPRLIGLSLGFGQGIQEVVVEVAHGSTGAFGVLTRIMLWRRARAPVGLVRWRSDEALRCGRVGQPMRRN